MEPRHYCLFDTALGAMGMAWRGVAVTHVRLPEETPATLEKRLKSVTGQEKPSTPPEAIASAAARIREHAAGGRVDYGDVAVDLAALDALERAILEAARTIEWGRTVSYGALARLAGHPGKPRETGRALGHNPVPVIVPCHRVVTADFTLGGFSAPGGATTKQRLLALEEVHVGTPVLPGLLAG